MPTTPTTFLDDLSIYNAKSAVVIKNLIINGDTETATLLSSLKSTANDESLTQEVRLNALTALINKGGLLDIATPPYFPSAVTFAATQVYTGLHNDLSGLNTGDYYHLTYSEYLSVLSLVGAGSAVTFENLSGNVSENPQLVAAFGEKEDVIASGTASKFFAWDKTWKDLSWSYVTDKPTTLAGYGVSASDTLFDGKYITPSSVLTSYVIGANTPVTNTSTLVGAIGNLQAQINNISSSTGTISTVGINTPSGFFLNIGNNPLTGSGGYMSLSLASQSQNTVFAAPSGSNGTPVFRSLVANDLPASGVTADTYGDGTQYPIITVDDYGRITNVALQTAGGTGTVQSVEVNMPTEFISTGNPITTFGSIDFAWDSQAQGLVLASPAVGSGTPGFRALAASDIPNIEISQVNQLAAALANNSNLNNLANGQIWIGNASSQPTQRAISGVISIDNTGATYANQNNFPLSGLEAIPQNTLLGRYDAPDGDVQVVTLSSDFNINSYGELWLSTPPTPLITVPGQLITYNASLSPTPGQDALPPPSEGQILIGWPTRPAPNEYGLIWVTPSGVIDNIANDGTVTLADNSIDYNKLLDSASANVLLGVGSTPGAISALNSADATAILDSFAGTIKGLVPGGSGGDDTLFLSGAGTWLPASGGGGTTTYPLTNGTGILTFSFDGSTSGITVDIDNTVVATLADYQALTNKTLSTNTVINVAAPDAGTIWYSIDAAGTVAELTATGNGGKYLRLNAGTELPEWAGASSGIAIGDTITGATAGSVLFAGTAGVLAQANGDFFWDNTNKYLGIGNATPECGLHVVTSGSSNIKGVMNMHFDSNADNQAKFIGARARGNKNNPAALQNNDRITSLSGRGYKASSWSNTVGGFYIYASENWTNSATGTYLTFRGVVAGGTTVSEWARMTSTSSLVQLALGESSAKTGALMLYNSANAFTTTIQASASATASATYTLPTYAGVDGQVLKTDGTGVLSWVNAGPVGGKYISTTTATVLPASTAFTLFVSLLIPANTYGSGNVFRIIQRTSRPSGTPGAATIRMGFNTTNSVSGAGMNWLVGSASTINAGTTPGTTQRHISINGTTTSFYGVGWGNASNDDIIFAVSGAYSQTTAIDWTVDQYLIIGASVGSGSDSLTNIFTSISPV